MPNYVAPSHYLFYGALHRRFLWLEHLSSAFKVYAGPSWVENKEKLDKNFQNLLSRLVPSPDLGLKGQLPLSDILDDTPIESFLSGLHTLLSAYEGHLFQIMQESSKNSAWTEELEQISSLWGRELAQECLTSEMQGPIVASQHSTRGLFEAFQNILHGGDFFWKPLLSRRYTDTELQYELRFCAHQRMPAPEKAIQRTSIDLACWLEGKIFKGFSQALLPNVSFERQCKGDYCQDHLEL